MEREREREKEGGKETRKEEERERERERRNKGRNKEGGTKVFQNILLPNMNSEVKEGASRVHVSLFPFSHSVHE